MKLQFILIFLTKSFPLLAGIVCVRWSWINLRRDLRTDRWVVYCFFFGLVLVIFGGIVFIPWFANLLAHNSRFSNVL